MSNQIPSIPLYYLLPLRLWVGLSFVIAGQNKLGRGNWGADFAPNVEGFISSNLENAWGFYRPFLEGVVLTNTSTFAVLVAWGEFLFGLSVLFGLFTRVGAAVGIFIIANFTFTIGRGIWLPGMDAAYIFALFTLAWAGAGRAYGVDMLIRERWPKIPLT